MAPTIPPPPPDGIFNKWFPFGEKVWIHTHKMIVLKYSDHAQQGYEYPYVLLFILPVHNDDNYFTRDFKTEAERDAFAFKLKKAFA